MVGKGSITDMGKKSQCLLGLRCFCTGSEFVRANDGVGAAGVADDDATPYGESSRGD